jgi:uncharacterized protein YegP (UPF0339 family)
MEKEPMYFVLYRDIALQWRWALFSENHRKIADSAEAYFNKSDAQHGIALVRSTTTATTLIER